MIVICLKFIISLRGGHCHYSPRAKKNKNLAMPRYRELSRKGKWHKKRKCWKLSIFVIRTEFLLRGSNSLTVAIENVPNSDNHRAVFSVHE